MKEYTALMGDVRGMAGAGTKIWMDPSKARACGGCCSVISACMLICLPCLPCLPFLPCLPCPACHACLCGCAPVPVRMPSCHLPPSAAASLIVVHPCLCAGQLCHQAGGAGGSGGRRRQPRRRQPQAGPQPEWLCSCSRRSRQRQRGGGQAASCLSGEAQPRCEVVAV